MYYVNTSVNLNTVWYLFKT